MNTSGLTELVDTPHRHNLSPGCCFLSVQKLFSVLLFIVFTKTYLCFGTCTASSLQANTTTSQHSKMCLRCRITKSLIKVWQCHPPGSCQFSSICLRAEYRSTHFPVHPAAPVSGHMINKRSSAVRPDHMSITSSDSDFRTCSLVCLLLFF